MIVDAHCHAWRRWPYEPAVPDPESRGTLAQLRFEMDGAGVERAVIICAGIDHNPDNNAEVFADIVAHDGRFVPFADIDSRWTRHHKQPGAADRLAEAAERFSLRGFTHYLDEAESEDGGWLHSTEGEAFLACAERSRLILSLACAPHQMPTVAAIAERHPDLVILLHHLARVRDGREGGRSGLLDLIAVARHPRVIVKISGFGYAAAPGVAYPYDEVGWIVRMIHEAFGAERMAWGSDYPVTRRYMTYPQSLATVQRQCRFMSAAELALVLGGTMERLLASAGTQA